MSWSVSFTGQADEILQQLQEASANLTDRSKEEYDEVLPALKALVQANTTGRTVSLQANGHATFSDDKKTGSECRVTLL
jgi:hypothetical protein